MHFVFNILHEKTLSVINATENCHMQKPTHPEMSNGRFSLQVGYGCIPLALARCLKSYISVKEG